MLQKLLNYLKLLRNPVKPPLPEGWKFPEDLSDHDKAVMRRVFEETFTLYLTERLNNPGLSKDDIDDIYIGIHETHRYFGWLNKENAKKAGY